jgi:hypothetical protein
MVLDAPPVVPPAEEPLVEVPEDPLVLLAVLLEVPLDFEDAPELLWSALVVEPVTSPLLPDELDEPEDPEVLASAVVLLVPDEPLAPLVPDDPLPPAEDEARFELAFDAAWKPLT